MFKLSVPSTLAFGFVLQLLEAHSHVHKFSGCLFNYLHIRFVDIPHSAHRQRRHNAKHGTMMLHQRKRIDYEVGYRSNSNLAIHLAENEETYGCPEQSLKSDVSAYTSINIVHIQSILELDAAIVPNVCYLKTSIPLRIQ